MEDSDFNSPASLQLADLLNASHSDITKYAFQLPDFFLRLSPQFSPDTLSFNQLILSLSGPKVHNTYGGVMCRNQSLDNDIPFIRSTTAFSDAFDINTNDSELIALQELSTISNHSSTKDHSDQRFLYIDSCDLLCRALGYVTKLVMRDPLCECRVEYRESPINNECTSSSLNGGSNFSATRDDCSLFERPILLTISIDNKVIVFQVPNIYHDPHQSSDMRVWNCVWSTAVIDQIIQEFEDSKSQRFQAAIRRIFCGELLRKLFFSNNMSRSCSAGNFLDISQPGLHTFSLSPESSTCWLPRFQDIAVLLDSQVSGDSLCAMVFAIHGHIMSTIKDLRKEHQTQSMVTSVAIEELRTCLCSVGDWKHLILLVVSKHLNLGNHSLSQEIINKSKDILLFLYYEYWEDHFVTHLDALDMDSNIMIIDGSISEDCPTKRRKVQNESDKLIVKNRYGKFFTNIESFFELIVPFSETSITTSAVMHEKCHQLIRLIGAILSRSPAIDPDTLNDSVKSFEESFCDDIGEQLLAMDILLRKVTYCLVCAQHCTRNGDTEMTSLTQQYFTIQAIVVLELVSHFFVEQAQQSPSSTVKVSIYLWFARLISEADAYEYLETNIVSKMDVSCDTSMLTQVGEEAIMRLKGKTESDMLLWVEEVSSQIGYGNANASLVTVMNTSLSSGPTNIRLILRQLLEFDCSCFVTCLEYDDSENLKKRLLFSKEK